MNSVIKLLKFASRTSPRKYALAEVWGPLPLHLRAQVRMTQLRAFQDRTNVYVPIAST